MNSKRLVGFSTLLVSLAFAGIAFAGNDNLPRTELNINHDGKVLVRNAKVTSVATTTVNAVLTFGSSSMNWVINVDSSAEIVGKNGSRSSMADVSVNDVISFQGSLTSGSPLTVQAKVLKNWSVQKKRVNYFGPITSIDSGTQTFVFNSEEKGSVIVKTSAETKYKKTGTSTDSFASLKVGDIVRVKGSYDNSNNTLDANEVKVFFEKRRVFEGGKIKTLPGTSTPTTMVVAFGKLDYTVHIDTDTAVVNKNWAPAALSSFKLEDHVRVYGVAEGINVEATVIRNLNL